MVKSCRLSTTKTRIKNTKRKIFGSWRVQEYSSIIRELLKPVTTHKACRYLRYEWGRTSGNANAVKRENAAPAFILKVNMQRSIFKNIFKGRIKIMTFLKY